MKREDIKKEAQNRCDKRYSYLHNSAFFDGFMSGADWYINNVWHDAGEIFIKPGFIILEFKNKHDVCYNIWRIKKSDVSSASYWNQFMKENKVIRYAYIEDLIPNTEE